MIYFYKPRYSIYINNHTMVYYEKDKTKITGSQDAEKRYELFSD